MFNNYFNNYVRFTSISKVESPLKFAILDIKFHWNENPHQHVRNFVNAMTLKGINKDIFHIVVPWTFDEDIMKWYNACGL